MDRTKGLWGQLREGTGDLRYFGLLLGREHFRAFPFAVGIDGY